MKPKRVVGLALVAFAVASLVYLAASQIVGRGGDPLDLPDNGVVVLYVHTNRKCPECDRIRVWARRTIEADFSAALASGRLCWRTVNIDRPVHRHVAEDYGLYVATVVLLKRQDGRDVRWKNLESVWDLVADESRFAAYIRREASDFLGGAE